MNKNFVYVPIYYRDGFVNFYETVSNIFQKKRFLTTPNVENKLSTSYGTLGNKDEINRGYYTVARRYEFYFRVAKQYFTNERSE